ncbi:type I polyketide synthase [Polyangium jinanense]|uniref:type I polyketide synthase n=1 Tax=Polyangium jinanense TaxID=2829994 RepID=UPI00233FF7E0|nr:type I polyketide synthase [Polyangium jinanense]
MTTQHEEEAPPASGLSSMQRAIMTIQKMRAKIENLERARVEPIAIIGMGCRFPGGANTPEAFFRLLEDGVDTIREVPPERWSLEQAGPEQDAEARALRWGSFLDDVDRFDAAFFNISPREAESLDPQQRLLLEVSWEALERAGQMPERLMGSRTGVYIGIWALDYQQRVLALSPDQLDAYCFTGNVISTAAGRLSYVFGLQGPAVSVETACSSSLTAIHLACQSLRSGETNLALAGGVNLMLSPATTKLLSKTQALSPDGRCKSFDARANGFVRGEGCGVVVLKRLSDAERDGDPIIAVIRGSAVNQDGRSTGLTAPNVLSQQALLRQALESARVAPSDVGYVEAHGTGTSLGDPIEVEALKAVLGGPRERGSSCVLGAVKTNIGHLEAAAGVAGLMKVALSMQNDRIPGNLHFRSLNPRIDLRGTSLEIAQHAMPWKAGLRPRIGGVSSFGISGTNAHVVLEEAPRNLEEQLAKDPSAYLLPLSAKTPEALLDLARSYQRTLASADGPRLLDIAYTASARRSHFEHRLAVVGGSKDELAGLLGGFLRGEQPSGVVQGKATPARAKVVFVFSGQGSQWLGMGRKLYDEESAFRSVIDSCDALLTGRLGWSILDELYATEPMSRLAETQVAQPMLFAIQIALVELLRSWGIAPDAVIGHSVGEIAAAHIAGILSLDEAIRLVAIRGRIMQKATGAGKMVSVAASPDAARTFLAGYEDRISIAAVNDPNSIVLAGQTQAMDEVVARIEREGISCRPLRVNYAFHSPQMAPFAAELVERLVRVDARRATLAMYSTVLSECVEGKELDARYWGRNVRETVNLAGAVGAAIHDGYQLFLEVGPHPVLASNVDQCLAAKEAGGLAVYSMRRGQDERRALLEAIGGLYTRGCFPEWARLVPTGGRCVPLPTYPWQKKVYWIPEPGHRAPAAPRVVAGRDVTYEAQWQNKPRARAGDGKPRPRGAGAWLVFSDQLGTGAALCEAFRARGETCVRVVAGDRYESVSPDLYRIDPADRSHYTEVLGAARPKGMEWAGIVHLQCADDPAWGKEQETALARSTGAESLLHLAGALATQGLRTNPRIWLVTRGAQAVGAWQEYIAPVQAAAWGLSRTLVLEHPEIEIFNVDLDPGAAVGDVEALLEELGAGEEEDRVALRKDGRFVSRLARSALENAPGRGEKVRADARYLVTGAFEGLGLLTAQSLVGWGARHLVLVGRKEPSEATKTAIQALEEAGAEVVVTVADLRQRAGVDKVLTQMKEHEAPPLRGVFHAALVAEEPTRDADLESQRFGDELSSGLVEARHLLEIAQGSTLDAMVLYSSVSAILGYVGRASYAATSAFLDTLAGWLRSRGVPATAVEWGAITGIGLASGARSSAAAGLEGLSQEEAMAALSALVGQHRVVAALMRLDVRQWLDIFPQLASSPFWADLRQARAASKGAAPEGKQFRQTLETTPAAKRLGLLETHVAERVARALRMDPTQIGRAEPFRSLGVDSLMSIEVRNVLERDLGKRLPATLLFTYPHVAALAEHLLGELDLPVEQERIVEPAPPTPRTGELPASLAGVEGDELLAMLDEELANARKGSPG